MKIGLIASIWIPVPPPDFGFGAQEYIAYELAEGLVKKGHEVTLFASGDSKTSAKLVSITQEAVEKIMTTGTHIKSVFELLNVSKAYQMAQEFDIIHNHLLPYGALFSPLTKIPTVHTLHHAIYSDRTDKYLYEAYKSQNYISISNAQRSIFPELNYVSTVYNGIDENYYSFKEKPAGDYIVFISRMKEYKGLHTAIKIANLLDVTLKIAVPLPIPSQADYEEVHTYWENRIKPQIGGKIEFLGGVSGKEKVELLQNAKLFLFPVERNEPFGMTIIEAMSCGTPFVGFCHSTTVEIIGSLSNNFARCSNSKSLINGIPSKEDVDDLTDAVKSVYDMNSEEYLEIRKQSRERVAQYFTMSQMVDNYERVYNNILIDQKV